MTGFLGIPRDRILLAAAMLVALASAVSWLQHRFETSDVKKGIALALGHRPRPEGPTLLDALAARGEGDLRCGGEIVSTLLGDVRVSCATPRRPDVSYEFRVLLDGRRPPRAESGAAQALVAGLSGAAPQRSR
jgi:hypothetical protein